MPNEVQADGAEAAILRGVLRLARALRQSAPRGAVSGGALSLLVALQEGGPASAVALAGRERLQPQSLSRRLLRLEQDGLIARAVDLADRRRHVIAITPAGLSALGREMRRRRVWLADIMAERLDDDGRETLVRAAGAMLRITSGPDVRCKEDDDAGE